ncbi:MAG: AAA family ATPase [Butyrivibrio sp.]|nr:AAA family ATPase [Butyrivibrio sp.]
MQIDVIFEKFIHRNEKTGESAFYARIGATPVKCVGTVYSYPQHSPLSLTGQYDMADGSKVFTISSCHIFDGTGRQMHDFLSDGKFNGIGAAVANITISEIGNEVVTAVRNSSLDMLMQSFTTNKESIFRALSFIKSITDFEDTFDYIKSIGGDYFTACMIFEKFGKDSKERVINNPYILRYAGATFAQCEKIAFDAEFSPIDEKRVRSVVETALEYNHKSGNTRIAFDDLCNLVSKIESEANLYKTPILFIAEEVLSNRYVLEEKSLYVYTAGDYNNENSIICNIRRLNFGSKALKDTVLVSDIEKELNVEYSDEQRLAFNCLKSTGIKIITGSPGTGKTTLLNGLLKKYEKENPGREIALCAPTGCAARKMQEHTGRTALTIHKMIGICPFDGKEKKETTQKLTADCIVIDECSMIDNEIMALLLKCIKNDAIVIMLGDKDQLPPVDAGNTFADMIESGEIESYELKKIFRQTGKSLIVDNSRKVIAGDKTLETDKTFCIARFDNEDELVKRAVSISNTCRSKGITDIKFYTPSRNRKFKTGTICLNKALRIENKTDEFVEYGPYIFCVGDKVIFNHNNYEKGYFNGEEGTVASIQKMHGNTYVKISTDDGPVYLQGTELQDIELAYAITAHKAQGSECKNAVIIIPKKPASMLQRQLLYVEITRAKENVMILSEKDALEDAISSKYEFTRNTGLIEKLRSA